MIQRNSKSHTEVTSIAFVHRGVRVVISSFYIADSPTVAELVSNK